MWATSHSIFYWSSLPTSLVVILCHICNCRLRDNSLKFLNWPLQNWPLQNWSHHCKTNLLCFEWVSWLQSCCGYKKFTWLWNLHLCSHSSWSSWTNSCMSARVVTFTWIAKPSLRLTPGWCSIPLNTWYQFKVSKNMSRESSSEVWLLWDFRVNSCLRV